jgi:branched-chain amino acid aminotransferase
MNMFVVFKTKDGGKYLISTVCFHDVICSTIRIAIELVTPPLDGMILPGVTRDSVLSLARDHASGVKRLTNLPDKLIVSERPVTMKEVKEASQSGSLVELFGAGNTMSRLTLLEAYDRVFL